MQHFIISDRSVYRRMDISLAQPGMMGMAEMRWNHD